MGARQTTLCHDASAGCCCYWGSPQLVLCLNIQWARTILGVAAARKLLPPGKQRGDKPLWFHNSVVPEVVLCLVVYLPAQAHA